jgi:hypothetical protein
MLQNLRNAGPLLQSGEVTRTHRVRAPDTVQVWFASLTADERGRLLAGAMTGGGLPGAVQPPAVVELPAGVTVLRVTCTSIPPRLRNEWRWQPQRYADLERYLAQGDALRLRVVHSRPVWRTVEHHPIRRDVVLKLFESGCLAVETTV